MPASYFDNPFHVDARGDSALTLLDEHIRDMIYEVLFTAPGERVNLPDFGCGVRQLLFMGNSDALAVATQFLVQGSLQRWLGDVILAQKVEVTSEDSTLRALIQYVVMRTNQTQTATFTQTL